MIDMKNNHMAAENVTWHVCHPINIPVQMTKSEKKIYQFIELKLLNWKLTQGKLENRQVICPKL